MLLERGRAKAGPDHMLLGGDQGPARSLGGRTSSGHAGLSGLPLLPLAQLHRHAQLDLVEHGIPLRAVCTGNACPEQPRQCGPRPIEARRSSRTGLPILPLLKLIPCKRSTVPIALPLLWRGGVAARIAEHWQAVPAPSRPSSPPTSDMSAEPALGSARFHLARRSRGGEWRCLVHGMRVAHPSPSGRTALAIQMPGACLVRAAADARRRWRAARGHRRLSRRPGRIIGTFLTRRARD